jgi:hypothetical protein
MAKSLARAAPVGNQACGDVVCRGDVEASAVCIDVAAARILVAAGLGVVLFGPDGATLGLAVAGIRAAGPGRVAVLVGEPSEPDDRAAAAAMAAEQFGVAPVEVGSPGEAEAVVRARPTGPRPRAAGSASR